MNSLYLIIIAALLAFGIGQCGQKNDAQKALIDVSADLVDANVNKVICETTRESQGETIRKLQAESDQRKKAASIAMAEAKYKQDQLALVIEGIRRTPRTGEICEGIRLKMIEGAQQ